jgi:hypothetical protein
MPSGIERKRQREWQKQPALERFGAFFSQQLESSKSSAVSVKKAVPTFTEISIGRPLKAARRILPLTFLSAYLDFGCPINGIFGGRR